jgi:murein DD-endopeptidase MepM/ murein hydrolase activator NlpD
LTLPFGPDTKFTTNKPLGIAYYADMGTRPGYNDNMQNWKDDDEVFAGLDGTDICVEENTPILAAASGTVIQDPFPPHPRKGICIMIETIKPYGQYNSLCTAYWHLNEALVKPGDVVKRGDVIGLSGRIPILPEYLKAIPNGVHLHFEVDLERPLSSGSYYTGVNEWVYTDPYQNIVPYKVPFSDGSLYTTNLWTKFDDPQFP